MFSTNPLCKSKIKDIPLGKNHIRKPRRVKDPHFVLKTKKQAVAFGFITPP